jgi:hypothetical protein
VTTLTGRRIEAAAPTLNTISAQLTADGPTSARDLDRAGKPHRAYFDPKDWHAYYRIVRHW